ncbi:hypothetical protein Tco_0872731 [Tanacetum coccineum]
MVTDKLLFGKFVKNNVVKNGNEVLDDVGDIKKEKGFEDNKKNKWADWKELVFKGSGKCKSYNSTAHLCSYRMKRRMEKVEIIRIAQEGKRRV